MSGEKFTKGEWCIRTSKQMKAKCIVHYVNGGKMPLSEGFANAHLITCAPEMYRVLKFLVENDSINDSSIDKEVLNLLSIARGEL
jgi:hypothetical protein